MSLGSPALAAYSLVLTALNSRSVYRRVKASKYRHKKSIADALVSLQQTPLELTDDPRLLDFIPHSDQWRQEIGNRLGQGRTWSLATATSVTWVVIAYLLTLVDSFVSLNQPTTNTAEGLAVGTLWLWSLCLVAGWMWVPIFSSDRMESALDFANEQAVKEAAEALKTAKENTKNAAVSTKTKPATKLQKEFGVSRPIDDGNTPVGQEKEEKEEQSIRGDIEYLEGETDQTANPLPNPSHHVSAVSFQIHPEDYHDHDHPTVSAGLNANQSAVSVARSTQPSINPNTDDLLIRQKLNSLNRDEHRLSATFNYSRIMRYIAFVDDVLRAVDKLVREKEEVGLSRKRNV